MRKFVQWLYKFLIERYGISYEVKVKFKSGDTALVTFKGPIDLNKSQVVFKKSGVEWYSVTEKE